MRVVRVPLLPQRGHQRRHKHKQRQQQQQQQQQPHHQQQQQVGIDRPAGRQGSARKKKLREARRLQRRQALDAFKAASQVVVVDPKKGCGTGEGRWSLNSIDPCMATAQAQFFSKPVRGTLKSLGFSRPTPLQAFAWPVLCGSRSTVPVLAGAKKTTAGTHPTGTAGSSVCGVPPFSTLVASPSGTDVSRMLAYLAPLVERLRRSRGVALAANTGASASRSLASPSPPSSAKGAPTSYRRRQPPKALFIMPSKARCLMLANHAQKFEKSCGVHVTTLVGSSAAVVQANKKKKKKKKKKNKKQNVVTSSRADQLSEIHRFECDAICTTPGNIHEALKDPEFPLYGVEVVVLDDVQQLMDRGFAPQLDTLFQYLETLPTDNRRTRQHQRTNAADADRTPETQSGTGATTTHAGASGSAASHAVPGRTIDVVFATAALKGSWVKNLPLMSPTSRRWIKAVVKIQCTAPTTKVLAQPCLLYTSPSPRDRG